MMSFSFSTSPLKPWSEVPLLISARGHATARSGRGGHAATAINSMV